MDLKENFPKSEIFDDGTMQGLTDFRRIGYGGPCPPSGTHRYFFKIYALDTRLNVKPGLTKKEILKEMEGHIIAEGQLMGKYKRK
jgi:Raf kinase inhibitor-like YbhB/YbcL family protein